MQQIKTKILIQDISNVFIFCILEIKIKITCWILNLIKQQQQKKKKNKKKKNKKKKKQQLKRPLNVQLKGLGQSLTIKIVEHKQNKALQNITHKCNQRF